jgi:hypothetical protein
MVLEANVDVTTVRRGKRDNGKYINIEGLESGVSMKTAGLARCTKKTTVMVTNF